MRFKKLLLPTVALAIVFTIASCGNEKNEKDEKNEVGETQQQEAREKTNDSALTTNTATVPAGEIPLDKLPAGVKEYVAKNYAGYTMVKAASDPLCQGGDAIDVAITKAGASNLSLIFRPDGTFVQHEEDVPLATATTKIKEILKAKYADYSAGTQIEKVILADKTVQYLVDLSKGNTTKEVIFSTDGKVVCEK